MVFQDNRWNGHVKIGVFNNGSMPEFRMSRVCLKLLVWMRLGEIKMDHTAGLL